IFRGVAVVEQQRGEEGLKQIQEGFLQTRAAGAEVDRSEFIYFLAEAYSITGRLDDAIGSLNSSLILADKHENFWQNAEIYRLKGEVLLRLKESNSSEAQACLQQGLEIARQQGAKTLELRATTTLARLLAKQGKRDEARVLLAAIYGWFVEG